MKVVLLSMLATAMGGITTLAAPSQCQIACLDPSRHDPKAASACNCAEKYCPVPEGRPNIPAGYVWGWNEETDSCGPVPDGEQCAGLDVTCVSHYTYRWNGVDTCQCLPLLTERITPPICRIECIPPSTHDPNALPTTCNCDEKHCPHPQGPGGPFIGPGETWAYNATAEACGSVYDPEAECLSLDVECIPGYNYGWSEPDSACLCTPDTYSKRTGPICDIACVLPMAYDPHAVSPNCNCAERVCSSPIRCPPNTSFGWDQAKDACGCVPSPEAQCEATGFTCLPGYFYGWNAAETRCRCMSK